MRFRLNTDVDWRRAVGVGVVDAIAWVWFLATAYTSRFTDQLAGIECYSVAGQYYAVAVCVAMSALLLALRWDVAPRLYRVVCATLCCATVATMFAVQALGLFDTPLNTIVSLLFVAAYFGSQVFRAENLARCGGAWTLLCALMVSLVGYYGISALLLVLPVWAYDALIVVAPLAFLVRFGEGGGRAACGEPRAAGEVPPMDWRRWVCPATVLLVLFGLAGGLLTAAGSTVPARVLDELFHLPSPAYLVMVLAYLALGVLVVRGGAIRQTMFFAAMSVVWMLGSYVGAFVIALFPTVPIELFAVFAGVVALLIVASFVVFRGLWVWDERPAGEGVGRVEEVVRAAGLTKREAEVFRLLAAGRSLPYVQERLVISEGTARTHIKHIYAKLGVHSKQELIDLVTRH